MCEDLSRKPAPPVQLKHPGTCECKGKGYLVGQSGRTYPCDETMRGTLDKVEPPPLTPYGIEAAGKKLCGMCDFRNRANPRISWHCNKGLPCPWPEPENPCVQYYRPPGDPKSPQLKKKGLPVPEGVKFIYVGAPRGKTKKGVPQHQGVVTVAWIETTPGLLRMAFSFCSPQDRWCKGTGRDMVVDRLYEQSLVIPFLYSPKRTVHEVVRAILSHDFGRLAALTPGATMYERVPSWTRGLAKRMSKTRVVAIYRLPGSAARIIASLKEFEIKHLPLAIMAQMMRDIAALGNG